MRTQIKIWLSMVALAAMGLAANTVQAAQEDELAVRRAAAKFYLALNDLFTGDVQPMIEVWSHADDVTYMGPAGGYQIGWDQVFDNWEEQARRNLGGSIKPTEVEVVVAGDLAVAYTIEQGENTDAVKGLSQQVSIRATNVFRKEDGTWKMIGHHTDLLPFLQDSFPQP